MKKRIVILTAIYFCILFASDSMADMGEINIGGFISQGFLQTSENNYLADTHDGSAQFNEMGIYFKTSLPGNLRIGVQFFGRDLGEVGNNEFGMNWAFAEKKWSEVFGIRAGLIKTPFGLYGETRDMDMLRTSIFLPSSVYNEWFRDANQSFNAIEFFGNINLGAAGTLQYQVADGETSVSEDSGTALFYKDVTGYLTDVSKFTVGNLLVGALTWLSPIDGFRVKGYYTHTEFEMDGIFAGMNIPVVLNVSEAEYFIFSAEYILGDFLFATEYSTTIIKSEILSSGSVLIPETETETQGYYVNISYRINEKLVFGTYFADNKNDKDAKGLSNRLKDIAVSAKYDISDNWIAKVECHKMQGLFGVQPEKTGGSMDEDWYLYAAKLTYFF